MFTIILSGVSCGRCEGRISQAVRALDVAAELHFSADRQRVEISSRIVADELAEAIRAQGYGAALPAGA